MDLGIYSSRATFCAMTDTNSSPRKVSLFVTCLVDQMFPEVAESTVLLLERLGVNVEFSKSQTCCGQPAFNSGFWKECKPLAEKFISEYEDAEYIVMPSGSCTSMVKIFYNELFQDDPEKLSSVGSISKKIYELSEFIVDVLGIEDLSHLSKKNMSGSKKRRVTYHEACHLRRELGVQSQPRKLIESLGSVELVEMHQSEVCCGFGGAFSVKYPEISGAMLQDKIENINVSGAAEVVSSDVSCLMHIGGGLKKRDDKARTIHIAELLCEESM